MQDLAEESSLFTSEDPIQEPNLSATEATPQDPNSLNVDPSAQKTNSNATAKEGSKVGPRRQFFFHKAEGVQSLDDFEDSDAEKVGNALLAKAQGGYLNGCVFTNVILGWTYRIEDEKRAGIDNLKFGIRLAERSYTFVPTDLDIKVGVGVDKEILREFNFSYMIDKIPKNPFKNLVADNSHVVACWEVTKSGRLVSCSIDDIMLPDEAQESSSKKALFPSASAKKKKSARDLLESKDDGKGLGKEELEILNEVKKAIKDGLDLISDIKKEGLGLITSANNQVKEGYDLIVDMKKQVKEGYDLLADVKKQVNDGFDLLDEIKKQLNERFTFEDVLNLQAKEGQSDSEIERTLASMMAINDTNEKKLPEGEAMILEGEAMVLEEKMGRRSANDEDSFMAPSEDQRPQQIRALSKTAFEMNLEQKINEANKEKEMKKQKSQIALRSANKLVEPPLTNINDDMARENPLDLPPRVSRDTTYVSEGRSSGEAEEGVQGEAGSVGMKKESFPHPVGVSDQDIPFPRYVFRAFNLQEKLNAILEKKKAIMEANEKKKKVVGLKELEIKPFEDPKIVAFRMKQAEEQKKLEEEQKGQEPCVEQGVKLNYEEANYDMSGKAVDGKVTKKRKAGDGQYEQNKLKRVKMGAKSADGKLG